MQDAHPRRLDSWKEIARYLDRDVTTVRRWEKREGLPVHRHLHRKLGSVYAYCDEIDAWWRLRSTELSVSVATPGPNDDRPRKNGRAGLTASVGALVIIAAALLATASGHTWTSTQPDAKVPVVRASLTPPDGLVLDAMALSPDHQQVALAAIGPDGSRLWIRRLDSTTAYPLQGTEGAAFPFWSPDGSSLGFFAAGRLKRINIGTREVVDLAAAPEGRGGTWNDRGDIVFAPDVGSALFRVSAAGGPASAITKLGQAPVEGHAWPEFLPDGDRVIFTDYTSDRLRYGICVIDLDSGRTTRVLAVYSSAAYSTKGYLLFADGALMSQPFDPVTLELSGQKVMVADRVLPRWGIAHKVDLSVSRTGVIAVRSADDVQNRLTLVDRAGHEMRTFGDPAFHGNPALSPDGRQLVATVGNASGASRLWLFDVAGGSGSPLTFGSTWDGAPVWSSDGRRLIFASSRDKRLGLYEQVVGGGSDKPILKAPRMQSPDSWSTDGRYLTVQTMQPSSRFDVWAWDLAGDRLAFPVLTGEANEGHSQISPDGQFVAYASDESGRFEVYVKPFPSGDQKWLVSSAGGVEPRWRRDGRELYYIAADRTLTAVSVTTAPTFRRGTAVRLFDTRAEYLWQDTRNHYDVSPDGRRFVALTPVSDRRAAPYTIVVNWEPIGQ